MILFCLSWLIAVASCAPPRDRFIFKPSFGNSMHRSLNGNELVRYNSTKFLNSFPIQRSAKDRHDNYLEIEAFDRYNLPDPHTSLTAKEYGVPPAASPPPPPRSLTSFPSPPLVNTNPNTKSERYHQSSPAVPYAEYGPPKLYSPISPATIHPYPPEAVSAPSTSPARLKASPSFSLSLPPAVPLPPPPPPLPTPSLSPSLVITNPNTQSELFNHLPPARPPIEYGPPQLHSPTPPVYVHPSAPKTVSVPLPSPPELEYTLPPATILPFNIHAELDSGLPSTPTQLAPEFTFLISDQQLSSKAPIDPHSVYDPTKASPIPFTRYPFKSVIYRPLVYDIISPYPPPEFP